MRKATAELILKDPDRFAHHDRVFLNNPWSCRAWVWPRWWCWPPPPITV